MFRTQIIPKLTPLHSSQNFYSNKSLFAQIGLQTRELRPFYIGNEICPEISERATLNVFSITPEFKLDKAYEYLMFFICTPLNQI
jgi:hypothetical protein